MYFVAHGSRYKQVCTSLQSFGIRFALGDSGFVLPHSVTNIAVLVNNGPPFIAIKRLPFVAQCAFSSQSSKAKNIRKITPSIKYKNNYRPIICI